MSFGFGFGFPRRLTSGGGLSPSLYLDFVGTNSLPSTVTFSRGTNATLTDSNGRIAWAPHNLLTNSEDFEAAAWTKGGGATIVANATTAPDGTATADKLRSGSVGGEYRVQQSIALTSGVSYTFSGYVKRDEWKYAFVYGTGSGVPNAFGIVDLDTGAITTTPALGVLTATAVGNNWYQIVWVFTSVATASDSVRFGTTNSASAVTSTGNGTDGIFIWGAQLNVANAPVNLLTWSEQFNNAAWQKTQIGAALVPVVTANAGVAPDGTSTADRISFDCVNTSNVANRSYINQTVSYVSGAVYSASLYVKAFDASNVGKTIRFYIDALGTGVIHTLTADWARVSFTGTSTLTGNSNFLVETRGTFTTQTADVLIWGAQLNTGSVALPYVATTSSIYLPPAYNPTTPKNLLGFTQEPENAAWTKSNSYVQQNLLLQSNDFQTSWAATNTTRTLNSTTSPSGGTDGVKIEATTTAVTQLFQGAIVTATSATGSVYVKQGTSATVANAFVLRNGTTATNLVAGTLNYSTGVFTYTTGSTGVIVTNAGNGWWRISLSATSGITSGDTIQFFVGFTGFSITAGDHFFAYGAQLVQGSTAGDYTQTTSAAAPTRYLNWDGTLTGRKLVEDTATSTHQAYQNYAAPVAGLPLTFTVYAKAAERTKMTLYSMGNEYTYDLVAGTISGTGTAIQSVGNGWYRCSITLPSPDTANRSYIVRLNNGSTTTYTGDGTSGIYVSDFQLSNSASVDPYVYNPQAAAASAAYYGPRFDYNPTGSPIPSGVELVTNGTFDSASGWSTGGAWVISGGAASITAGTAALSQSTLAAVAGRTYQVTFTISAFSSGGVRFEFGGINGTSRNAAGTYTQYITTSSTAFLVISPTATSTLSIDNVSVQEVTGYTATANGLLIEEQRTNLLTYSEQFDNAIWQKTDATVTPNVVVAPDGTTTGDALITSVATNPNVQQSLAGPQTGVAMVFSFYARAGTTSEVSGQLFVNSGLPVNTVSVTGTIISGPGSIDSSGATSGLIRVTGLSTTQWTRIAITGTPSATSGLLTGYIKNRLTGATVGDTAYIWGAQMEQGSFATSYIPTVASQVTRNADSASMLGDNFYTWYNPNQGTLNSDYIINNAQVAGAPGVASISDNTNGNRIQVSNVSGDRRAIVTSGGVVQFVAVGGALGAVSVGVAAKLAIAYRTSDFAACANAGTVVTQASGSVPGGLSRMYVGAAGDGNFQLNGTIRRIGYYNTRLPNATLQALTV